MLHHTPLIATIVAGLVVAFVMGAIAHRLRVSPIAGYLLAGVLVGPFTPGFVANAGLANELAEIGVILLMFGVGLHFSLRDLLAVRNIAVPGAIVQITVATLMGMGLAWLTGWGLLAGFVFGLALSVASTVVLLRALQGRDIVQTERGRIAVGWLIVEDLVMVLALVLLPVLAGIMSGAAESGSASILQPLLATFLKVAGFIALMLIVGRRVIPWALQWVVATGSRELFRLAVLAIALGVAFGAALAFDVSFALGAFFAGMILGETSLSRRATEETLPLRDAFAVLFFVSVGMLFNPSVVVQQPLALLGTVAIIVFGKSLAAYLIVHAWGYPRQTGLTVAASLAQIGEFSFILASLGTELEILPAAARDVILAGAMISIFLNPFLFSLTAGRHDEAEPERGPITPAQMPPGHIILVGYGRVGSMIGAEFQKLGKAFIVIEDQGDVVRRAREEGVTVIEGNALEARTLVSAGIGSASKLLIAIPAGFEGGAILQHARLLNATLPVIARAHSQDEVEYLTRAGVDHVVMGERELANRMMQLSATMAPASNVSDAPGATVTPT
ncbi:YbaL family putative K(+) efflux transporter [Sphingomonas sp. HF-S4]|uniref:YbaL family putative K(+) efflux transporter n=1 Tax=Sphingomonas agrestis TaxID=3080540 RepID=A0ABU3Y7L7_9SPHN|nr:YbaL family putative K(+) efflux transporter [Sphingomonas sp. HF-S4]MDV3457274.1 YbaL family putative K(+) efflux transporter [Sphingomonas sp. HF-S4]